MNKQQMIDKAIEELKGNLPNGGNANYLIRSTKDNTCWGEGEYQMYGGGGNITIAWKHICTRKEFEDRVKELESMKKWNGEGLPPVGVDITIKNMDDVELSEHGETFVGELCKVMATFKNCNNTDMVAVQKEDGACACFILKLCVPIQSERDKVVDKACDIMVDHMRNESGYYQYCKDDALIKSMSAIYDAGMLKLPI